MKNAHCLDDAQSYMLYERELGYSCTTHSMQRHRRNPEVTADPEHGASEQRGLRDDATGQGVPGQGATPQSPPALSPDAQEPQKSLGRLDQPRRRLGGKSIWDWLNLLMNLLVPLIIGTIGFGLWQAHQQQQSDQQLALDQEHAAILQTYIGDMNDLLRQGLSASTPGDEIRQVATAQTVTTLRSLDANHNGILLQFLQDAHLIGSRDAVINLSGAELSGADLAGANLSGASLTGADLTGASLSGAILTNAILSDAILVGADLSGARLGGTILSGADLSGADLNGADITQAQLDEVRSCADAILSTGLICQQRPLIQLTYWYTESPAETPVILNLINQFNRQNPGIHINAVQRSYFQARAAFTAAAHDGNAPDVFRSDIDWTTLFASKGYLLNIDQYVSQRDLSDYLNAPLSTTRGIGPGLSAPLAYDEYKGDLYGLPQVTDFLALLYNKKELAKAGITGPPSTMADFEADGVKVVQKEAAKYGFETGGNFYYALPFLYASGGGMFDQHNNILVDSAGSVAGLNFLVKLQNADNVQVMPQEKSASSAPGTMVSDFMEGKTAMIFDGPYDVKYILSGSSFNKDLGNLGIAGIPTGPSGQTGSPIGGQSYVISAGTAYPAQAYQFIKFMSSTASQVAIASVNHTLPTRQSAYRGWVSSDPVIKAFLSIKDTVVARPAIAQDAYLLDSADPSIWAALTGAQCADDALNAVAYSWNQLGAGNLVSQSTFTPGASPTACA